MRTKKSNIELSEFKKQFEESEKRYETFRKNQMSRIEKNKKVFEDQENRVNDRFKTIRRK